MVVLVVGIGVKVALWCNPVVPGWLVCTCCFHVTSLPAVIDIMSYTQTTIGRQSCHCSGPVKLISLPASLFWSGLFRHYWHLNDNKRHSTPSLTSLATADFSSSAISLLPWCWIPMIQLTRLTHVSLYTGCLAGAKLRWNTHDQVTNW